jgi:hypothetical protein
MLLFAPLMVEFSADAPPSPYKEIIAAFDGVTGRGIPRIVLFRNPPLERRVYEVKFEEAGAMVEERSDDVTYHEIVANFELEQLKEQLGDPQSAKAILHSQHDKWIQDPFCVLELGDGYNALLQPYYSDRIPEQFISVQLAEDRSLQLVVQPTRYWLEGGNILIGENFALLGKDLLVRNWLDVIRKKGIANAKKADIDKFEADIRQLLGKAHLFWPGFDVPRPKLKHPEELSYQPAFHLDLFLTLGGKAPNGKEIILHGDPAMAWEVCEQILGERAESWLQVSKKAFLQGFQAVLTYIQKMSEGKSDGPQFEMIALPWLTWKGKTYSYNNCLVEEFDGKKYAYVPSYLVADADDEVDRLNPVFLALEAEVERQFSKAGFEPVCWVKAGFHFRTYAAAEGSLNCISKVLRRSR